MQDVLNATTFIGTEWYHGVRATTHVSRPCSATLTIRNLTSRGNGRFTRPQRPAANGMNERVPPLSSGSVKSSKT